MLNLSIPAKEYPISEATNILDKNDWDVLIILDGCRWDVFNEVINEIYFNQTVYLSPTERTGLIIEPIKVPFIISPASSSGEWLHTTFSGRKCKDIVYVTGTPWLTEYAIVTQPGQQHLGYNPFHEIVLGFKYETLDYSGTSNPTEMSRIALETREKFPGKRLIVHNMQPHFPFIGAIPLKPADWESLRREMFILDKTIVGEEHRFGEYKPENSLWKVMKEGIITREEAWQGYKENLKFVLKQIPEWKKLGKRVIISADHGECFLDYGMDGHPSGMRIETLVKVPWFDLSVIK